MRRWKKGISMFTAAALFLTVLPAGGLADAQAAKRSGSADVSVRLNPTDASPFNDTDGDGFGEFEGWGTSLCWWANRLGYDETLTQEAARVFFSDEGLDMNIGRYNVGGGDYVVDGEPAQGTIIYGAEDEAQYEYGGKGTVGTESKLNGASYKLGDVDFGIHRNAKIPDGSIKSIGWINELGAEADPESGSNLTYKVTVEEAGTYIIKTLWTMEGSNKRAAAMRVNEDDTAIVVSAQEVNENLAAQKDNVNLFLVVFPEVELKEGENQITFGGDSAASLDGKESWGMNFSKLLVRPKGNEADPAVADEFAHDAHIVRSDSVVPGYCTDVTKIDLSAHDLVYYEENFARADVNCGYAWNYDWDADSNQMNILKAAMQASGEDFIAEAFSNSPPYFMTYSGCSSGAVDSSKNNLRADSYDAFGAYMADVIVHWAEEGVVNFQSATPMNEPDTSYWGANSDKQEGCHFDPGNSQSKVILALKAELQNKAAAMEEGAARTAIENIIFSGTDETDIDKAITSYNKLSEQAKEAISRIDTHTYSGSKRSELRKLAQSAGKNLWMSEVDGAFTGGKNAGEMSAGLGLAQRIMDDLNGMRSTAWILWNAVDMNVDRENRWDPDDLSALGWDSMKTQGYWGIAIGEHNTKEIVLTKKYDAFGQFSRYIRPGYSLIATDNKQTLAAYDPKEHKVVIVAMNTSDSMKRWKFDLTSFTSMGEDIEAYRTCVGERWEDVSMTTVEALDDETFEADLAANSIVTYVIPDVGFDREKAEAAEKENAAAKKEKEEEEAAENKLQTEILESRELDEIPLNADMVTGSEPWSGAPENTCKKVVDGKIDTFFDGVTNGWLTIDLGENYKIAAVDYAPRSGYASRCVGASIYGSNDGSTWDKLYTISETPPDGMYTRAYADQFQNKSPDYRYIKYAVPEGDSSANCNIAEIKLFVWKNPDAVEEFPDTLEKLVSYCSRQTEGKSYSEITKKNYDSAMAEAEKVIADKGDDAAVKAARKKLLAAYQTLSLIRTSFSGVDGDVMYDTEGKVIQAHGGQIQQFEVNGKKKWYWIGEDKTNDYRPCPGVHMYSSDDLYNWTDEGVVLKTAKTYEEFLTDKYFTDLYGDLKTEDEKKRVFTDLWQGENSEEGCVIERPKMLYNDKTGKYVIWFHADGQSPFESSGGNYAKAKAGVAVSDSPTGPYKLLGSYLLNTDPDADHGFDNEVGGHVRDMNLFKDDDGTGYVMYSSDGNATLHIAKLNEEYTNVAQPDNSKAEQGIDFTRNFIGESREAPAMFKYKDTYYLITSGCTGWNPNPARYAVAKHPLGPWTMVGDPCTDEESNTTYHTQSTCVFPVDAAKGQFIYMGDRWRNSEVPENGPGTLKDSRYVWLPVEFVADGKIALRRYTDWTLDELENKGVREILTDLPDTVKSVAELKSALPEKLQMKMPDGETKELAVEWTVPASPDVIGTFTIQGTLKDANNTKIEHEISIVNEKMIYFFDSIAEKSDYVETAKETLGTSLRNREPDQSYSAKTHAGFAGVMDTDVGVKSTGTGIWDQGYYAKGNKTIDYAFDLEAGEYTVITGYQEWWNTSRPTKITVLSAQEEEKQLATHDFTLGSADKDRQESVSFTVEDYGKVIVSVSKTGSPDPVLSWIAVIQNQKNGERPVDKASLYQVLEQAEGIKSKGYTADSWEKFQAAYQAAAEKLNAIKDKPDATQAEVDEVVKQAEAAMALLVDNKTVLEKGISDRQIADADKEKYTEESWKVYADALLKAQALLEKESVTEKEVSKALKKLSDARDILEVKKDEPPTPPAKGDQTISYTQSYQKTYGEKAFSLGAKVTAGNGTLTYKSSDEKVAAVSGQGIVTIKGTGICTITITASATEGYNAKSVEASLKVVPKKVALKSAKAVKGKKLSVKWKKAAGASGYEVQCCQKKNFKTGVKSVKVKKAKTLTATVKKLKKGKKYYVRVRAYKDVKQGGKTISLAGKWSKVKLSKKVK